MLGSVETTVASSVSDQARVRSLISHASAEIGSSLLQLESSAEPLSDAMRALQFEDLAVQISRAADERLTNWCQSLAETLAALDPQGEPELLMEAVADRLEAALAARQVHMPADQSTVDEGDAVVF